MNSSHMRKTLLSIPPLLSIPFFQNLKKTTSTLNIQKLQSKLKLCYYTHGDTIIQANSQRQFIYILRGGIAVHINEPNSNDDDEIRTYYQNEYLGETETVNHKFVVKAIAMTTTVVYRLSLSGMYQHLRAVFTFPELEAKISQIKSLPYFVHAHQHTFQRMIECSKDLKPSMNSILYSQGQRLTSVYVIMRGDFQLSKKIKRSRAIFTIDVSTVSIGQCLGIQQTLMNQLSQETVKCVSSNAWIVQLDRQAIKDCISSCNKSLIKSRSNWRKQRVEDSGTMIEKYRSTYTEMSQKTDDNDVKQHHQSYDDYVRRKSVQQNSKYITNKTRRSTRPQTTYYRKTDDNSFFNLLPSHSKKPSSTTCMSHNRSQLSVQRRQISNSQIFFQQFLQKKQRVHNNMLMKYLKTRPPELVFNPEKEYAVMKSLNVRPSNAVNNKKKIVAILKHKYYKQEQILERFKE